MPDFSRRRGHGIDRLGREDGRTRVTAVSRGGISGSRFGIDRLGREDERESDERRVLFTGLYLLCTLDRLVV